MKSFFSYRIIHLFFGICLFGISPCSAKTKIDANYSFEAALDIGESNKHFDEVEFTSFNDLNLGFFKGRVWIKVNVSNGDNAQSLMVINNDLMNRNYQFFKLNGLEDELIPISGVQEVKSQDARFFDFTHPNFKMDLASNEEAIFFITTYSDGRWLDATPKILGMTEHLTFSYEKSITSMIFFVSIFVLLLINVYQGYLVKRKIYVYYLLYMLATFVMYFGLEGHLYTFVSDHLIIDHIVFVSVRLWFASLLIYTSHFLNMNRVVRGFNEFLKTLLILVLGGTTVYQFMFFKSSIENLRFFDNTLSFFWLLLILTMVILAAKRRKLEFKYYSIPLLILFSCIFLGLADAHFQILPGSPFLYIKMGTIAEFVGFTYFITRLVKQKIDSPEIEMTNHSEVSNKISEKRESENKTISKKTIIKKTDLVSIFKLLESSLTNESEWEEFKIKLENLDPNFFSNLLDTHPNLSKSEIRLLSLIKIGYTQKQIASILGIEPNSVKKSKYRARKKLCLTQSILLKEYLLEF